MSEDNQNISKENRSGKIALAIVGVLALGLGIYRISYSIKAPFMRRPSAESVSFKSEEQKMEELKKIDTDGDGINDYEELYLYETSPYLKDSDSDGIDDKTEIDKGTDPNCPEGKKCNVLETPAETPTSTIGVPLSGNGGASSIGNLQMTPDEVRDLLKKAGASEDSLKKISDEELMKVYQESLQQAAEEEQRGAAGTP